MPLRRRLLLVLVGSGTVIVAIAAVARELIVSRAAASELRSALEARVDAIGRERCEQGNLPRGGPGPGGPPPDGFGPPERRPGFGAPGPRAGGPPGRRPIDVLFYADDLVPRLEYRHSFPESAREALRRGETFVAVKVQEHGPEALAGVLATGWDSARCAYAVAFVPMPPPLLSRGALALASAAFLAALAGALFVASASPVRRIRSLADGVRIAAAARYETGVRVEGRDEIADLAGAFNEAAATVRAQLTAVEERERALREFVAHTTHDVGLPLTVLAGALTEIRERGAAGQPADAALRDATRETQYIASLLHNLGAVARLETDDALRERHPVDLGALVERVALRHAAPARDASVELNHAVPGTPVTVVGDVTLLEQAVNNLVHNAIRYNRPGGHVAVVLDLNSTGFALSIGDDGPGVSQEELAHLGEPWFRGGDARTRRPEGTGLGLSIARAVTDQHGLRLQFRRPDGGGFEAVLAGELAS